MFKFLLNRLVEPSTYAGALLVAGSVQQAVAEPSFASILSALLLRGHDEISLSLTRSEDIAEWQRRDRIERPWVYQPLSL